MNYKEFIKQCATRNIEIYRKHLNGVSFMDLTKEYNLSHPRIRAICERESKKKRPRAVKP